MIKKLLLVIPVLIATTTSSLFAAGGSIHITFAANVSTFSFRLSAAGGFDVSCAGTLSGPGVSGTSITRATATAGDTYTCTGHNKGEIYIGGLATAYYNDAQTGAISFLNNTDIVAVEGDPLSAMFPRIGNGTGYTSVPSFYETFAGCKDLEDVSDDLFAYYDIGRDYMFANTFASTALSEISGRLFGFSNTVNGAPSMFEYTFDQCEYLDSVPAGLFDNIITGATAMFRRTFSGCVSLKDIPKALFTYITTGAADMFAYTFSGCTLLGGIPDALFENITTSAASMFEGTFEGCTGLSDYIPRHVFSGLVASGSPYATDMMKNMFANTGSLATTTSGCPNGTVQYTTGYESYWNNHISCEPLFNVTYSCGTGTGTPPATTTVTEGGSFTPASGSVCSGQNGYGAFSQWQISGTNVLKPAGTAFTWTYTGNKTLTAQYTPNTLALNWYNTVTTMSVDSASQSCTYDGTLTVPSAPSARTGFTFAGWEVRPTYNFSTIPNTNGVEFWAKAYESGTKCWYDTTTGDATEVDCASDPNFADLANPTSSNSQRYQWKVRFPDGILYGFTRCSETQGTVGEAGTPSSNFGYNGWCMATGWKPNGATSPSSPTASLQWVMGYIPSDGTTSIMNARCKRNVARTCANRIRSNSSFRTALFTPAQ